MLFSAIFLASTASATCLNGLSKFKRAETVEVNTFGYGPMNGPFNWASLAPENEACKSGKNQSPINVGMFFPRDALINSLLTISTRCLHLCGYL
jgi:carbonic anhydrase